MADKRFDLEPLSDYYFGFFVLFSFVIYGSLLLIFNSYNVPLSVKRYETKNNATYLF